MEDERALSWDQLGHRLAVQHQAHLVEYLQSLDPKDQADQEFLAFAYKRLFDDWGQPRE